MIRSQYAAVERINPLFVSAQGHITHAVTAYGHGVTMQHSIRCVSIPSTCETKKTTATARTEHDTLGRRNAPGKTTHFFLRSQLAMDLIRACCGPVHDRQRRLCSRITSPLGIPPTGTLPLRRCPSSNRLPTRLQLPLLPPHTFFVRERFARSDSRRVCTGGYSKLLSHWALLEVKQGTGENNFSRGANQVILCVTPALSMCVCMLSTHDGHFRGVHPPALPAIGSPYFFARPTALPFGTSAVAVALGLVSTDGTTAWYEAHACHTVTVNTLWSDGCTLTG